MEPIIITDLSEADLIVWCLTYTMTNMNLSDPDQAKCQALLERLQQVIPHPADVET